MDFHHHHHHHHHRCMSLETTAAHSKKVRFSRCSHVHLADCREFSQGSEHSWRSAACPFPQLTLFFFATHALPFSRLTPPFFPTHAALFPDSRRPFSRLTPSLFFDSRRFFPTHASTQATPPVPCSSPENGTLPPCWSLSKACCCPAPQPCICMAPLAFMAIFLSSKTKTTCSKVDKSCSRCCSEERAGRCGGW